MAENETPIHDEPIGNTVIKIKSKQAPYGVDVLEKLIKMALEHYDCDDYTMTYGEESFTEGADSVLGVFTLTIPDDVVDDVVRMIYSHKFLPYKHFLEVSGSALLFSVESGRITEISELLRYSDNTYEGVVSEAMLERMLNLEELNAELAHRVESIEEFMKSSGMYYYRSMMAHMVDALHDEEIIDKDELKTSIFTTTH